VINQLDKWAADRPAPLGDPLFELPMDRRVIRPTPKGVVLILSAWNFNISLCLEPLVDVLAAGNCAIVKPSEISPACGALLEQLVHRYLPTDAVRVVQGGVPETTQLLTLPFDHIVYTGSSRVGKIVMAAAAKNLTPVTLELGGKNPTFIDKSAKLKLAAERTLFAKATNAGQWCVDADYVLADEAVAEEFGEIFVRLATQMLGDVTTQKGEDIDESLRWYNRIISTSHTRRIKAMLDEDHGGKVLMGGPAAVDVDSKFIPFTVVLNPKAGSKLMTEEIFGPILVIRAVSGVDEAIQIMKEVCATPLALYVYSEDTAYTEKVLTKCTSGSVGVNTTIEQSRGPCSPFGGVGQSGMGAYHGKFGFDEFSHKRTILYKTTKLPLAVVPQAVWPVNNKWPSFVPGLLIRLYVTGLVPGWLRLMVKAVLGVLLAAAATRALRLVT